MILQKLDQLWIIQQHGLGNWTLRFLLFWSKFWTLSFGISGCTSCYWRDSSIVYYGVLRGVCVLLASNRHCWLLLSSTTFQNFWCHWVCRVHVCTENRTRLRHCPAGSHSQVGTLSHSASRSLERQIKTIFFCYIETHSRYCSLLAG